ESRHVRRDKACEVQGLIQNLDRDLTSVGMAAEHGVVALPDGNREHVGVVGKQQIGRARNHEFPGIEQVAAVANTLEIDTGQVQQSVAESENAVLVAQNMNSVFGGL